MKNDKNTAQAVKTLPPETTKKVQELLLKMNSQTEYTQSDYSYTSKILSGLVSRDGSLVDVSCMIKPVEEIYEGCAKIETENFTIEVNPKTGEILMAKKPFFKSWKRAYSKVEAFLDKLNTNFDNEEVVEKKSLPMSGLTEKGLQKIKEESEKIYKNVG